MNESKYFLAAQLGAAIHYDDEQQLQSIAQQLRSVHSELALVDGLRLCHLFCGIPKLIRSLNVLGPFKNLPNDCIATDGEEQFRMVYAEDADIVLSHLQNTDPTVLAWVLNHAYGTVFANSSYSLLDREMASIFILTLGNCHQQALSHVRACARHGADAEQLLADVQAFSFFSTEQQCLLSASIRSCFDLDE